MIGLYGSPVLPFWTQAEILQREQYKAWILQALQNAMLDLNQGWRFERTDGPVLTPAHRLNPSYGPDDVWELRSPLKAGLVGALRPETTPSSYVYANHLLTCGLAGMPLCVWQAGKSFRREANDGARAPTLRFKEFYQLEFQLIYRDSTKADYSTAAVKATMGAIAQTLGEARTVESDRLPGYSKQTLDVEAMWAGGWKEMRSVSRRLDFPRALTEAVEVAVGLDRLVCCANQATWAPTLEDPDE